MGSPAGSRPCRRDFRSLPGRNEPGERRDEDRSIRRTRRRHRLIPSARADPRRSARSGPARRAGARAGANRSDRRSPASRRAAPRKARRQRPRSRRVLSGRRRGDPRFQADLAGRRVAGRQLPHRGGPASRDPRRSASRLLSRASRSCRAGASMGRRASTGSPGPTSSIRTAASTSRRLRRFVTAYQTVRPLTIGELWALAISLRLVLAENLRRLAEGVVEHRVQRETADAFADEVRAARGRARVRRAPPPRHAAAVFPGRSSSSFSSGCAITIPRRRPRCGGSTPGCRGKA